MSTRISIVLFDGFDELDAIAPFEVLRAAEAGGAPIITRLVSLDPVPMVAAGHGLRIAVEDVLDEACDWVLVPGGNWATKGPRGAWAEIQRGVLPKRLAELRARGKNMASVCTGGMILAAAGITKGRRAVTHHVALAALAESGALVVNERVVDDGDLITAGGVTSALDMALHLVERFGGAEAAQKGARRLEYERRAAFVPAGP